ncbi:unnamed protein product [Ectocarpus sp. CCAP 1310/34]|nr:unnamed protein product [Ectocarpus sp. CCAP 1310/34]
MTPSFVAAFSSLGFLAPSIAFNPLPIPLNSRGASFNIQMCTGSRAHFVRTCSAATIAVVSTQGPSPSAATTPTTVVNSVLSAYGIPMIAEDGGFTSSYVKVEDNGQETVCAYAYPVGWVEKKKADGFATAANYQTGDSLSLNMGAPSKAKTIGDVSALAIAAEATPSEGAAKVLQEKAVTKGGVNYTYLTVKYNTVTRSGYDVERVSYIAATVKQRKLLTLVATVSGERRNKMDLILKAIQASFRVGDVGVVETSSTDFNIK